MGSGEILPVTFLLMVLVAPSMVHGMEGRTKPPAPHFLLQWKYECYFANGTAGQVRYLERYIYDRQELVRFDSRRGTFEAVTGLGEPVARLWNSQKLRLEDKRASVDWFCRDNYALDQQDGVAAWKFQPTVTISHTKGDPRAHHRLLICTAAGYYPSEVTIRWLKNGQEQTEGVGYADELQNGDWTFHNQGMLEMVPKRGDVYACQVEHSSLKEPITVLWEPKMSNSSKNKMWTGALGAVLGVVFGAVPVSLYLRNRRGLIG
ncbi:H-2 class II histocompatibility antigen, E-S beta chain-like isoform X2 [Sphaerodactylus townsendi]|uniref:H-2 class II histocompatibility antigen, E-S beta chain-like isoform X2 n=1 Tax=Sphaerodactylus townsendi TaxID=933632 RepID=UPI0020263A06|nr:H-2 class II histocompatibility antigen, E-S beta chain-like isoform X2 [Sphaerodactylus townsendi]